MAEAAKFIENNKDISILQLDKAGGGKIISYDEYKQLKNDESIFWIRLTIKNARKYLKEITKDISDFGQIATDSLCAAETRPRTIVSSDHLLANFRAINLTPGFQPEDMVSVRLWMNKNLIISAQRRHLHVVEELENRLIHNEGPKDSGDFLLAFLSIMTDKTSEVVTTLDDEIDKLEDAMNNKFIKFESRNSVNEMRRRVIMLRRYLTPQRDAVIKLQTDKLSWINEGDILHLREIADGMIRILEDLDSEKDRTTVLHEELFTLAQERLNEKIYLLAIVTCVFMPLSFLTGLLGINVAGIPMANHPWAFFSVCSILFILALCEILFLFKRKWL